MFSRSESTREEAWFAAMEHLIKKDGLSDMNIVLEIQNPANASDLSRKIKRDFDQLLVDADQYSLHTVAETIFPGEEYRRHGTEGVFNIYPNEVYPIIQKQDSNCKGTYAHRLVRGINSKNQDCNPLENIINRMKTEIEYISTKKAAYEITLDDVDSIPVNRNDNPYMGFPCLSHLSFKLIKHDNKVHLTAMYRKHHYVQKALGNFLGLARLMDFVAREVGVEVGTLVCHSTFAEIDTHPKLGKRVIDKFIKDINEFKSDSV